MGEILKICLNELFDSQNMTKIHRGDGMWSFVKFVDVWGMWWVDTNDEETKPQHTN